ncbi:hypothetical protein LXL04_017592 [Taraxacum kok-saghyz]
MIITQHLEVWGFIFFSLFWLPTTVSHLLEACRSRFLGLGSGREMDTLDIILNSKENGGLNYYQ